MHKLMDEILDKKKDFEEKGLKPKTLVLWVRFKNQLYRETEKNAVAREGEVVIIFGLDIVWTDKTGVIEVY